MNDKKHIDRLFQEKLKYFEATPSNSVWENISTELQADKKDRKVIPLWLKLSAIAAVLLLMFTVGNSVFNSSDENPNQNTIVDTDNSSNTDNTNKTNLDDKQDDIIKLDNDNLEEEKLASEGSKVNQDDNSPNNNSEREKLINKKSNVPNAVVTNNTLNGKNLNNQSLKNKTTVDKNKMIDLTKRDAVAQNDKVDTKGNETDNNSSINKKVIDVALNKNNSSENAVAKNTSEGEETNKNENSSEEITKQGEVAIEGDGTTSIEEALAENTLQDDKKKKKKIEDRWKIAPSVAPVYFNTLGSGSSIHEQFNKNSKTGDVNMSYGVRGSYALNDKLSVRTGVNKVTLGYSTDDVFVLNNVTATPTDQRLVLRNIDLKEEAQDISFISAEEFNFAQIPSVISSQIIGTIDQKLGFIEIPLEIEYELSNQRLGLRVLGGVSALFLNENEVYSTLDGETTLIGSATNINKTSFSANLGVGLDFKLSEKFKLNLEPTFKYQLNTFNNTSGDFKPYFIGIYSGFSFKF